MTKDQSPLIDAAQPTVSHWRCICGTWAHDPIRSERCCGAGEPMSDPQPPDDRMCITCGKIGGTCRWSDDAQACMRRQLDELRTLRDRVAKALA